MLENINKPGVLVHTYSPRRTKEFRGHHQLHGKGKTAWGEEQRDRQTEREGKVKWSQPGRQLSGEGAAMTPQHRVQSLGLT